MTCTEARRAVQERVDGALPEPARRALDDHLTACPACRTLAADLVRIAEVARALGPEAPPAAVWERLAERLAAERAPEVAATGRGPLRRAAPWLAVAAMLVVAAGAGLFVWMRHETSATSGQRGSPSPVGGAATPTAAVAGSDAIARIEGELRLADEHYQAALARLEAMAAAGVAGADPRLPEALARSATAIDGAIADGRAALAADPQNEPARESLFEALRRKVTLVQDTIALVNEMRKGNQAGAARIVKGLKPS